MEHYKRLNAELIAKLQEMKIIIGSYQTQIVEAKRQLFEEQQKRVEIQQLLTDKLDQIGKICLYPRKELQLVNASIVDDLSNSTHNQRKSSDEILKTFRRSNIHQTVQKISPIRPRLSADALVDASLSKEEYSNTSLMEDEDEEHVPISSLLEQDEEESTETEGRIVVEESAEDSEEEREYMSRNNASVVMLNFHNTHTGTTTNVQMKALRNITNKEIIKTSSSQEKTLLSCDRSSNSENSIQNGRFDTLDKERIGLKPDTRLSDLTSWNILDARTSTPNAIPPMAINTKKELNALNVSNDIEMLKTGRPRRQCMPKNLSEPLLSVKLRNDHGKMVVNNRKSEIE